MAAAAVLLDHPAIVLMHLNLIGEIPRRERQRMEKPVSRLAVVFPHEVVGGVAIVARSELAVRRFDPTIELLPHDVAIDARLRIVRHVRRAVGVAKSKDPQPRGSTNQYSADHV